MRTILFSAALITSLAAGISSCELFPQRQKQQNRRAYAPVASSPFPSRGTHTAEFPGGMEGLGHYLREHIVYPNKALQKGIEGRVWLRFAVAGNGIVKDVQVIKGAHPLLNAEALRVLRNMPRWKPARENGKPVKSYLNLPVRFEL